MHFILSPSDSFLTKWPSERVPDPHSFILSPSDSSSPSRRQKGPVSRCLHHDILAGISTNTPAGVFHQIYPVPHPTVLPGAAVRAGPCCLSVISPNTVLIRQLFTKRPSKRVPGGRYVLSCHHPTVSPRSDRQSGSLIVHAFYPATVRQFPHEVAVRAGPWLPFFSPSDNSSPSRRQRGPLLTGVLHHDVLAGISTNTLAGTS